MINLSDHVVFHNKKGGVTHWGRTATCKCSDCHHRHVWSSCHLIRNAPIDRFVVFENGGVAVSCILCRKEIRYWAERAREEVDGAYRLAKETEEEQERLISLLGS